MRILVTGGSGFLGRHVTKALLARGDEVTILSRSALQAADLLTAGALPVPVDLRDAAAVSKACAGQDAVIHAGALSAAWGRTADFQAINAAGTAHVADACLRCGVGRLVYVSSPAVIFDGRDHVNADESAPYPPRFASPYALTKKLGEDAVRTAAAQGLAAVIVRPKAVFGPGDQAILPRLIAAARAGRLRRFGDGKNLVDLTYVDNVVHALLLALAAPQAVGRTYFITNDEHVALWPTIAGVLARLDIPADLRPLPLPAALAIARGMEMAAAITGREPLLTRYSVGILARTQTYNIAAARRDLGYAPDVSVAEGIERTVAGMWGGW